MALQAEIKARLDKFDDDELLRMFERPTDYLPEALQYAKFLLVQRGKQQGLEEQHRLDSPGRPLNLSSLVATRGRVIVCAAREVLTKPDSTLCVPTSPWEDMLPFGLMTG